MRQLDAGHRREHGHEQVLPAAIAGRRVVELTGALLGQCHQLGDALDRHGWVHQQHTGLAPEQGDACKVVDRVEAEFGVQAGTDGVGLRRQQQRVAVGGRLGHQLAADGGSCTGPVVDNDLLLQALAQLLGDDARGPIHRTAGRKRHHDANRPIRVVAGLGVQRRCGRQRGQAQQCCGQTLANQGRDHVDRAGEGQGIETGAKGYSALAPETLTMCAHLVMSAAT